MSKIADKLDELADRLDKEIDNANRPMTQNPTPKRMREYNSRVLDGNNLQRGQRALRALAAAHRANNLPAILAGLKTKAEILPLVRKRTDSASYYDVHCSGQYADQSPAGILLQNLIDNKTPEQADADAERDRWQKIRQMEDKLRFADIPGFFPTPDKLAIRMVDLAYIADHHRILEPSAGIGSIATIIKALYPDAFFDVLEVNYSLVEILGAKGFNVHRYDFLEWPAPVADGRRGYDRIVMNPPFENMQDVDHVRKAYELLAPGGRIVAIMSASPFFNGRKKGEEFRVWLDALSSRIEDLGPGAFNGAQAFRQTGAATKMVVINR